MDVSIVSINYNTSNFTLNFIESIIEHTPKSINFEIIIVDNCSKSEEVLELENFLKQIDKQNIFLIKSNINLGFGGGNMLGTQKASGKYIAFINNDIIFNNDCFSSLINFLNNNPNCGVCTPQQYDINLKPTSCFDYFHGLRKELGGRRLVEFTSDSVKRKKKHYKKSVSVDFIQGCFMFFEANKFAKIGGFDTNLFLYYEEMDICYRLKKNGLTSNLVPNSSFTHYHGASTKLNPITKKELKISQLYISRKHHNFVKHLTIRIILLIKNLFKPKSWDLIPMIITGKFLENSMKQKQQILFKK